MSFNRDYIYNHLPARFRREDKSLFLYRFLVFVGEVMDSWDETFNNFHESIRPATTTLRWLSFWLQQLFGWSWFPWWFTLADKRRVYGNFAKHLARRGTARGIELFLRDFGITALVHKRPIVWGEFAWGEISFSITEPLHLIVEIIRIDTPNVEACFWGEAVWGESFYAEPAKPVIETDIIALIKYQQPQAQLVTVYWRSKMYLPVDYEPVWEVFGWDQPSWAEEPEW